VTAAGSNTYCYDANGNMTTRNGSALTWYSYNLPKQINQGANYSQFAYGAGRGRYLQVSHVAASGTLPPGTETTVYVNNMFEQVTKPSGVVEYKHYLIVGNAAVAIRTLRTNGVNDCRYLHKDHLGSVDTITDESGNVLQKLSYDAFGARRAAATWAGALSSTDWANIASITHRGFTSHEQLDDVGLIHMNGRVYDPTIGRFVSADPTVQSPYMSQDLNRYSYVINNPLSIVDLSGFGFFSDFWDFLVGFVKFVAPVVIGVVLDLELGPYFSQLLNTAECLAPGTITLGGATLAGGTSAAVSAALGGDGWWGSLKAGLWGAIGAWIGFGVSEGAQTTATDHGGLLDIKHVEPDPDSPFWSEREGIAIADVEGTPTNNTVFVNGMLNNVDQAAAYALKQTGTPIGGDVTLFYNPTHGFVADVTEAIIMKFTGQSALGNELAQILTSGDYQWVVAHSQGTLIVNDALTTLSSAGFTFDNGLSITYFGSAANSLVAQGLSQSVGATFEGAFNSPFDAVGNVLGLNTLNPFRIVGSILAFPSLFTGGVTQHNCYPECAY
jgi:RHS repeat-associated protein